MWGGNAVSTSFALDSLPPIAAAAIRFALAAVFMVLWCRLEGSGLELRRAQIRPILILGFLLFGQIGTFNIGIDLSNSSHAVLLVNTAIFWVLALEHFVTREHRLTPRKVVGVVVASMGTLLVVTTSQSTSATHQPDDPSLLGDVVLLGSSLILSVKILYTRHALHTVETGKLIFYHDVIGTALFVVFSACTETIILAKIDTIAVVALLYQGFIVGGLCFAVQAQLLRKHAASQIAVFGFAAPLFGILLARIFREDPMSPWLLVAAMCVAGGIVLVNWPARTEGSETDTPT